MANMPDLENEQGTPAMSSTTDTTTAPPPPLSLWTQIHRDTRGVWKVFSRLFPLMEKIAMSPALDQLFEEALAAVDAGVPAEVFQVATDAIRAARQRQQQGQDPAPTTMPATSTGPQPVQDASTDGAM